MVESSEQIMTMNLRLLNTEKDYQVEKCFNLEDNMKTIHRMGPYGNVALRVASCYKYNEVVQLLLTNSALESLENISSQLVLHDESKMDEIKKLFSKNSNLHETQEDSPDNDYIDWSSNGNNLIKKAKEFRAQIDLYKTYDNQHHLITKLLIEIIDYYLNEYLVQQEHFSKDETQNIENYFKKAIEEQNYLKYFIKAYTLTNNFHRVLNKHLALYILHYFDPPSYSSLRTRYRLINCLAHIITLLINHPDIHKYQYNGITYRGLLMEENDLKCYRIGNYILNRSFVSTSKSRSIAQLFADNREENISEEISDHHDLRLVPVLLRYTIKQNQTAIDIEHISMVPDEEEVLILPFSVFQIKDRIENCPNMCSSVLVEINLEECQDCQQINKRKKKNKSPSSFRHQRKKRKNVVIIGLFVVFSLIVALTSIIIPKIKFNSEPQNEGKKYAQTNRKLEASNISSVNDKWIPHGITVAGGYGKGNRSNQLYYPQSIYIDDDQTIYVADTYNHRIVAWKNGVTSGQIVAGGHGKGYRNDQLNFPTNVILNKENNCLIICDRDNRRIVRWPRQNGKSGEIIFSNIDCWDLNMNDDGYLYVSDWNKNEVSRWKIGDKNGTIVAGGYGKGNHLNQLNDPLYIFVDQDHSVYVSDRDNHRVMKWMKDGKEGIIIAGGHGQGNDVTQLSGPYGIIVDQLGTLYVADCHNHRVISWSREATEGSIIVGGNGQGDQSDQFNYPYDLSFDRQNNLYVVDPNNHRIQKFNVNLSSS